MRKTSRFAPRLPFLLLPLCAALLASPLPAQDVLTVGSFTGSPAGPTVTVPISIRDLPGTPLGMDLPAASRIQALALAVRWSPASAVTAAALVRTGALAAHSPIYESTVSGAGTVSWVGSFDATSSPLQLTQPPTPGGDAIFSLVLTLSPSLSPGSRIDILLDPAGTLLSNQGGTVGEMVEDGTLSVQGGAVTVQDSSAAQNIPVASPAALAALAAALAISGALFARRH